MNRKKLVTLLASAAIACAVSVGSAFGQPADGGLKDVYATHFKVGTAYTHRQNGLNDPALATAILKDFNSVTHEDDFKPYATMVQSGSTDTDIKVQLNAGAKKVIQFCIDNNIALRGHALVWHQQTPMWFFRANMQSTTNTIATEAQMNSRMKSYITNMFKLLKDEYGEALNIYAYDVVNEIFNDQGNARQGKTDFSSDNENSMWVGIYGSNRFADSAFVYAKAARDQHLPNMKLFYNDFNEYSGGKRDAIVAMANRLKAKGMDGIGMQSHLATNWPNTSADENGEYRAALKAFAETELEIHVTELDITIQGVSNPPTSQQLTTQANKYKEVFESLLWAKSTHNANITSVSFWGVSDDRSWRGPNSNDNNYPLLYDHTENRAKKPAYDAVVAVVPEADWGDGRNPVSGDFSLTVTIDGGVGGVIKRSPNKGLYLSNEEVTLTAEPNLGFTFVGWGGDASGSNPQVKITMNGNKTVTASFELGGGVNLVRDGEFVNPIAQGTENTGADWKLNRWKPNSEGDDPDMATAAVNGDGSVTININYAPQTNNIWDLQLVQYGFPLLKDSTYTLTFEASAAQPRVIQVMSELDVDPWTNYFREDVNLTTEHKLFTFTFTMEKADDDNARIGFNLGQKNSTADVTIGNVTVVMLSSGDDDPSSIKHRTSAASRAQLMTVKGRTLSVSGTKDMRVQIRVVNMRGKTVKKFNARGGAELSLRKVPAGAYIIEAVRGRGKDSVKDSARVTLK